jgi:hypothetical protein
MTEAASHQVSTKTPRLRRRMVDAAVELTHGSILLGWLANVLAYNSRFTSILPNRFTDARFDYPAEAHNLVRARRLRINDLEANFFMRAILERRSTHVVEIGAYHLERAAGIARLFPDLDVYGLDITTDYVMRRKVDGVNVGPNRADEISRIAAAHARGGLLCCRGTLIYYDERQLRELFALAFRLGYDVAISEPNTPLAPYLKRSRIRTRKSWYHPYPQILLDAGFVLPDNGGEQIQCAISEYGEERTYIFAAASR